MTNVLPPLRDKQYGGAWSIHDPSTAEFLQNISHDQGNTEKFVNDYSEWMCENKIIKGIEKYKIKNFSAGTTETFDKFYHHYLHKRLRIHRGEYFYHHMMKRDCFQSSAYMDEDKIQKGDVVVMSCPFSDTGNLPPNFYSILTACEDLDVPVMLDMAYINISSIEQLDISFDCIKVITTSLSKYFPVENYRIGIRLMKEELDDTLLAYNQTGYVNHFSVHVGHELIKNFNNQYILDNYKDKQTQFCNDLKLTPSQCVIFGIDLNNSYKEYNRGGDTNRLCFSRVWDGRIA